MPGLALLLAVSRCLAVYLSICLSAFWGCLGGVQRGITEGGHLVCASADLSRGYREADGSRGLAVELKGTDRISTLIRWASWDGQGDQPHESHSDL